MSLSQKDLVLVVPTNAQDFDTELIPLECGDYFLP